MQREIKMLARVWTKKILHGVVKQLLDGGYLSKVTTKPEEHIRINNPEGKMVLNALKDKKKWNVRYDGNLFFVFEDADHTSKINWVYFID